MTLNIPQNFLSADEDAWHAAADKALKGAPRERLQRRTEDGQPIEPLYERRRDVYPRPGRAAGQAWKIVQRVDHPDPRIANQMLLEDLEGGADCIELVLDYSNYAGRHGISLDNIDDMARLLDGVQLELIRIRLDAGYESVATLSMLLAYAENEGYDPGKLDIVSCSNYIGKLVHTGVLRGDVEFMRKRMDDVRGFYGPRKWRYPFLCSDGRLWHGRGATPVQELALVIAGGVHYLRDLEAVDFEYERMTRALSFTLVAEADQLVTIAKARAMRRLWSAVLDAAQLPQRPANLHMETSWQMMSRLDPHVNMLRSTVACFAAGVGGADSVSVLPFTAANGLPDSFSRRVARNTQNILIEECNLHKVTDPGAGSGAIEALTDAFTNDAWHMFQQIEAEGGILQSLQNGTVQKQVASSHQAREQKIALRKRELTGVSTFPNLGETEPKVLKVESNAVDAVTPDFKLPLPENGKQLEVIYQQLKNGATLSQIIVARPLTGRLVLGEPFPMVRRLSESYEELRNQTEESSLKPVYLACLGTLAQFTARSTWASNAFAAGGIVTNGGDAHPTLEDQLDAFRGSDSSVVCLVGPDDIYAEQAEEVARAFKAAGATHVCLAGKPGPHEAAWSAAGVDSFLYAGCNLIEFLEKIQQCLAASASQEVFL